MKKKHAGLSDLSLIVYDFDGIMTDNRALIFENGQEAVFVNRSDGLAVKELKRMGIAQIILTSETNPVVKSRARKLRIPCFVGIENKKDFLRKYLKKNKIDASRTAFLGNDINDKAVMESIGWPCAPADAWGEIKRIARIVLSARGGFGVIREFLQILKDIQHGRKF